MIRDATIDDSSRLAEINVSSWRFAYKQIVPEEYLYRHFLVEDRIIIFKNWIATKKYEIYVYEDPLTKIIKGMMGFGKCEDEDKKNSFELHFLYIEPYFSRVGIGSEMITFFEQNGRKKDYTEFVIWVLEDNEIGKKCYQKNNYFWDGSVKEFQRLKKNEIRFIKIFK